jgi:hypothetical protein
MNNISDFFFKSSLFETRTTIGEEKKPIDNSNRLYGSILFESIFQSNENDRY